MGDLVEGLSLDQRLQLEARAAELTLEVEALRQIREVAGTNSKVLATYMGIGQAKLAVIERDADELASALRNKIEACGGKLEIVVTLPGTDPVVLNGFGGLVDYERPAARHPGRRARPRTPKRSPPEPESP